MLQRVPEPVSTNRIHAMHYLLLHLHLLLLRFHPFPPLYVQRFVILLVCHHGRLISPGDLSIDRLVLISSPATESLLTNLTPAALSIITKPARWVVRGFTQHAGIDFGETSTLAVKPAITLAVKPVITHSGTASKGERPASTLMPARSV